ncbi:MAG: calcium/sodium antiporter [Planctomycetales bacterium]|nr:calcium/sodium antiporter [Planctomycetales bacterium]
MPELMWPILSIIVGLMALVIGGELLVRGASKLALSMQISPLVVGLTVVAFGTSAPELGVSLQAAMSGAADVAVGNVVGSNICNVLLILGVSALVTPLLVSNQLIRLDVPLMVAASLAMWFFSRDLRISQLEGGILFLALLTYITMSVVKSRRETRAIAELCAHSMPQLSRLGASRLAQLGLIVAGLVLLGFGSNWLVSGAVTIAMMWNVSELIIGLTIVALGTSLPEIVTSVVASLRGERDIAVGNVVGSNLFNILCVLGLTGIITPAGIPISAEALEFDIPVMVAVTMICLPIFFTGSIISRGEGAALLFYYVAYTGLLISEHTHPELHQQFGWILGYIVLPLTLLTILASVIWSCKSMRPSSEVKDS